MKVGDYVRTKYGISKIVPDGRYVKIDEENNNRMHYVDSSNEIPCEWEFGYYVWTEDIIKSSPHIIDLIEVGDYVNGREVRDVYDLGFGKCYCFKNEYGRHYDKTYKIKSIVTKEQFERMEYKVR